MTADNSVKPENIRNQLERILQSADFKASEKQRAFLNFVVDEALAGRSSQLKGYTIAVSVYGRPEGFDPQVDPIVRVEARRLRRALDHYYHTAGKNDPVRIEIPTGSYVPIINTGHKTPPGSPPFLGDIALARETVTRESEAFGAPIRQHLAHLIVHGCLHLLGYDHHSDSQADIMESLETAILTRAGFHDPYVPPGV